MKISLIAAISDNYVIGNNELVEGKWVYSMPWPRISEDMKHFAELTKEGGTVIMGRKTWDSLPSFVRPLKERQNIIMTRDSNFQEDGIYVAHNIEEALEMSKSDNPYITGGREIYQLALERDLVDEMRITWIHGNYSGNVRFPAASWQKFNRVNKEDHTDEKSGVSYSFVDYVKK